MFGKKKDRKKLIAEYKDLFTKQLEAYKMEASVDGKKLREVFIEHHEITQSRAATNIIITRHTGGGKADELEEIDKINQQDEEAEKLFFTALDEFLKEKGEE